MGLFDSIFGGGGNMDVPGIEDYGPLLQQQADLNRINQTTPFGSVKYTKDGPQPMSFDDWQAQNPAGTERFNKNPGSRHAEDKWITRPTNTRGDYDSYVSGLPQGNTSVGFEFSPQLQTMFDRQFDPNAYDQYKTDYMGNYQDLMSPIRDDQLDRFQQGMFNRGQPEGGELYGDVYRDTIGDPNSRQDLMAATQAQGMSDNARMQDFNRLMSAMGGSQINSPNVDVMSAANLVGNINAQNQANQSSIWDTLPMLAGSYMVGAPETSWLWGGK